MPALVWPLSWTIVQFSFFVQLSYNFRMPLAPRQWRCSVRRGFRHQLPSGLFHAIFQHLWPLATGNGWSVADSGATSLVLIFLKCSQCFWPITSRYFWSKSDLGASLLAGTFINKRSENVFFYYIFLNHRCLGSKTIEKSSDFDKKRSIPVGNGPKMTKTPPKSSNNDEKPQSIVKNLILFYSWFKKNAIKQIQFLIF